jgi:hypothetical protein
VTNEGEARLAMLTESSLHLAELERVSASLGFYAMNDAVYAARNEIDRARLAVISFELSIS